MRPNDTTAPRKNRGSPGRPLAERFWEKVDTTGGPDTCWPWLASLLSNGYGKFGMAGNETQAAHRVAFFLANGRWARPMCRHTCEDRYAPGDFSGRRCCNPGHLREGTRRENVSDALASGRWSRGHVHGERILQEHPAGKRHSRAKLTSDQVAEIRRRSFGYSWAACSDMAREYDVTATTIVNIVRGKTWRHVA